MCPSVYPLCPSEYKVRKTQTTKKPRQMGNVRQVMQAKDYSGTLLSFRNDRMGARLMTLMNTIRIAQDYNIPYAFAWKMDGRTSEELLQPTQIFDEEYFNAHYIPIEPFREVAREASDLQLLPADCSADDFRTKIASGTPLLCQASNLLVLPWEDAADVAPRYASAINALKFSPEVTAAMAFIDETLADSGTAFHIRRGDIIYDPITSNQLWSNKYIPREFYEVLAKRLVSNPDARVLVFSDEPEEISRLKTLSPQILGAADVVPDTLTIAQRDFIELYAMSRCGAIYGPPNSGFSMTAALMGNITVQDVREVMDDEERASALDLLVTRLQSHLDVFLSDGDIGQSLPFAIDHLNKTKRSDTALALLRALDETDFYKVYFFRLLMRQNMIAGEYNAGIDVLDRLADAPLDPAIPGRLEGHWAEVSRLAAVASAHAGDAAAAERQVALSLWYSATHRPAIFTLAQLCSNGVVDPATFAIPFDPDASRNVPPQMVAITAAREGHTALVPPGFEKCLWVMPTDLMAYDWQLFLGKNLGRGFGQPEIIAKSAELFKSQFARHMAPDVTASVQGLYAQATGNHAEALTFFKTALAAQPENPLWIKRAAVSRLAIDTDDDQAGAMLERAAEIGGGLYRAQLADYMWTHKQRPKSLRLMNELCQDDNVLPELPFMTVRMMRQMRETGAEALSLIDKALAATPHVRRFMSMRAHVLFDMDNVEAGLDAVDQIVARFGDAGDVTTLRNRAKKDAS